MIAALAPIDNGESLPGVLAEDAYTLPAGLSFERWQQIGTTLQQMQRSVNWWVGDWLRYGEDAYGEEAYQAVKLTTGRSDGSLGQVAWVSARFPVSTRVPDLSWSHHRAVLLDGLPMPEARRLLDEAAEQDMPVRTLTKRAYERLDSLRGHAVTPEGDEVETADLMWVPDLSDLTDEARAAMSARAPQGSRRSTWIAGALWALVWAGQEDAFLPDRWQG